MLLWKAYWLATRMTWMGLDELNSEFKLCLDSFHKHLAVRSEFTLTDISWNIIYNSSSSNRSRKWVSPFCHWYLCKARITVIAWGKAKRTQLTINCFICWPTESACYPIGRGFMQVIQTNDLIVSEALWTLETTASQPIHQGKWWGVCSSLLYMHFCTLWQKAVSCGAGEWFSTGIHGENPGWIQSCLAFLMCKSAGDRPSRFKQIN